MECLLVFFALLVLATFAVRAAAGGEAGGLRRRSYQQVARQFSGRFTPGGFLFGQPRVRFRYGDTFAALTEASSRGPHAGRCTELQINWPDTKFRVDIACHRNTEYPTASNSLRRINSGDAEFDRHFVIRGADEEAVRGFLSDGVRWQIIRLLELSGEEHLYISIQSGRLCIQKPCRIRSFAALKIFVERSLELYDQAMITQAVGIEFVENGAVVALEHVICKVCGEEIEGHEMVYCQRCKTPHHGDCWQYAGACSVYGCFEKTCRRPQSASATNPSHTDVGQDRKLADGTTGLSS